VQSTTKEIKKGSISGCYPLLLVNPEQDLFASFPILGGQATFQKSGYRCDPVTLSYCLEYAPVFGFQLDDSDPVGFGLAEVIVSPCLRCPSGLDALAGERSNDSGCVRRGADILGGDLGFMVLRGCGASLYVRARKLFRIRCWEFLFQVEAPRRINGRVQSDKRLDFR